MVRIQRLEDLAAQVRNEARSHLACEPQAAVVVARLSLRQSQEVVLRLRFWRFPVG